MGLRLTQGDEKRLVQPPLSMEALPSPLSSRAQPRDLQFSRPAFKGVLESPACSLERRMKFAEATKFHRKSGGAKWRHPLSLSPPAHCL
jgi:hypothetical protein